ncbi:MAG TPA: non-homologous end-joining DNA ligase [Acidimicrobiia bacterium]|nr:non-homologous end-joining DNA ligase [Acidimicrobiia bacterium]
MSTGRAESRDRAVEVEGKVVRITSPDRVIWPRAGLTKLDLIRSYTTVAPTLLPHLRGRPVTLHRFPEGVEGAHFYQTRCPPHPDWVRTQRMYTFRRSGKVVDAPVIDDLASLVWALNLATIEFHPYLGTVDDLERPSFVVFDLDPGHPATLLDACRVALTLRDMLSALGLAAFPKTSGVKGMHVYVPLNSGHRYDESKAFARAVAELLAKDDPQVITRMTRSERPGKVFVDWSQNDAGKSTVVAYSLRGTPVPLVSMPVHWEEIEAATAASDLRSLAFTPGGVPDRIATHGDLFARTLEMEQTLDPATAGARR